MPGKIECRVWNMRWFEDMSGEEYQALSLKRNDVML
jgi:hypothetical protein